MDVLNINFMIVYTNIVPMKVYFIFQSAIYLLLPQKRCGV